MFSCKHTSHTRNGEIIITSYGRIPVSCYNYIAETGRFQNE